MLWSMGSQRVEYNQATEKQQKHFDKCQGYCNSGERLGAAPNTAKTAGNLQPKSRVEGESVDRQLLIRDIKNKGIPAKLT